MGRYDIALDKKRVKKKSVKPKKVTRKKRKGKLPVIHDTDEELLSETPRRINTQQLAARQITDRYEQEEINRDLTIHNGSEIIQTGPSSRNLTITGPNGYRVSIPVRRLNIRSHENTNPHDIYSSYGDTEIILTLSSNVAAALLNDIDQGRRRYDYEPL